MAIKNRFFKTTQGVPFEFAACKFANPTTIHNSGSAVGVDADATYEWSKILNATAAKAGTTGASSQAAGDFYLLRQNPTTGVITAAKNTGNSEVFRTGAYKSWPHQVAWCVNATTKQYHTSSQFIPEKCDAIERYEAAAATPQASTIASSVIPVGVFQELYFKVVETTSGNVPVPIWDYTQQLNATVTETQAWANIAAKINLGKDYEFFTATALSNGITITASTTAVGLGSSESAITTSRTFKLVATLLPTKSDPMDQGVTFTATYTTPASAGVGVQQQVEDMYTEALVRNGIGHFYTQGFYTETEMGIPSTLNAALGGDYSWSIYKISGIKAENSKLATGQTTNKFYIFIAVKNTATAQDTDATFHRMFGGATYNS